MIRITQATSKTRCPAKHGSPILVPAAPREELMLDKFITAAILFGSALFIYVYHFRPRKFDTDGRKQVTSFRSYVIIDWYLKASSLLITIAAIHGKHPLLLQFHDLSALRIVGLVLAGGALGLFVWAMWTLDAQYTPANLAKLPGRVVATGPYRFVRHPIYTANLLLLVALAMVSGSCWLLVNLAILVLYYVPTIRQEENAIGNAIPEYREYMKRTGRLLPRIRPRGGKRRH